MEKTKRLEEAHQVIETMAAERQNWDKSLNSDISGIQSHPSIAQFLKIPTENYLHRNYFPNKSFDYPILQSPLTTKSEAEPQLKTDSKLSRRILNENENNMISNDDLEQFNHLNKIEQNLKNLKDQIKDVESFDTNNTHQTEVEQNNYSRQSEEKNIRKNIFEIPQNRSNNKILDPLVQICKSTNSFRIDKSYKKEFASNEIIQELERLNFYFNLQLQSIFNLFLPNNKQTKIEEYKISLEDSQNSESSARFYKELKTNLSEIEKIKSTIALVIKEKEDLTNELFTSCQEVKELKEIIDELQSISESYKGIIAAFVTELDKCRDLFVKIRNPLVAFANLLKIIKEDETIRNRSKFQYENQDFRMILQEMLKENLQIRNEIRNRIIAVSQSFSLLDPVQSMFQELIDINQLNQKNLKENYLLESDEPNSSNQLNEIKEIEESLDSIDSFKNDLNKLDEFITNDDQLKRLVTNNSKKSRGIQSPSQTMQLRKKPRIDESEEEAEENILSDFEEEHQSINKVNISFGGINNDSHFLKENSFLKDENLQMKIQLANLRNNLSESPTAEISQIKDSYEKKLRILQEQVRYLKSELNSIQNSQDH